MRATRFLGSTIARLAKEPLLHFTVAGALLFMGYGWLNPSAPSEADGPVRVGQGEIGWLRETFSSQWRRDPTDDEMTTLVGTLVQEHLLAREARALGLDQDDTIIRRRLAQKLTFLVDETTRIGDPDDLELQKYQAVNAERYRSDPRLSFQQIFYSPQRRASAMEDAKADLARMTPTELPNGDPLPLEFSYSMLNPSSVSSLFGHSFSEAVTGLKTGVWAGPLKSAYGVHLVMVTEREEAKPRSFEEVRSFLLDDWRRQKASDAAANYIQKLRVKYGVAVDDHAAQYDPARTAAVSAMQ